MTLAEQKELKTAVYNEANRCLASTRDTYQKAGKDGKVYTDRRYVRMAGNTAYHAVIIGVETYLALKDAPITNKKDKNIEGYRKAIGRVNKNLLKLLIAAYDTLHLYAGYDGGLSVGANQGGLELAEDIVAYIKP